MIQFYLERIEQLYFRANFQIHTFVVVLPLMNVKIVQLPVHPCRTSNRSRLFNRLRQHGWSKKSNSKKREPSYRHLWDSFLETLIFLASVAYPKYPAHRYSSFCPLCFSGSFLIEFLCEKYLTAEQQTQINNNLLFRNNIFNRKKILYGSTIFIISKVTHFKSKFRSAFW